MNSPAPREHALSYSQHSMALSRLAVPKQAPHYVLRTRLLKKLADSNNARLTVIAAPAGFGKTTLAAEWARSHSNGVAWLSLDTADNHLVRFWLSMQQTLQGLEASLAKEAMEVFGQSVRDGYVDTAISLLLNELQSIPQSITLILDDYHAITNETIHESMNFFIGHLPPSVKLILVSRTLPPLALSRVRVQQELLEFNSEDLRFTLEEIQELQAHSPTSRLTEEELYLLEQKTEGWIAGLILAFMSLSEKQDRTAYMHTFSGNNRYIFDYLLDEVLSKQSANIQQFLLQTSLLNSFSPALAAAVTEDEDAELILQEIEALRLFIIPLDDTRTWFRYHHLFAEMLKSRLHKRLGTEECAALHRRAALWYDKERLAMEAIRHAFEAEDYVLAAACMARHFHSIVENGEETVLLQLLDRMPMENMIVHPDLFYFQAGAMAVSGRPDESKRFLHKVETFMKEDNHIPVQEQAVIQMKLNLYRASVAFYQGDIDTFIEILDQNTEGLQRFASIVKVVNVGEALLLRGPIGFGGRLKKMAYLSAKVSTSEERRALVHYTLQGHGFIFLSDLYYEWNRLDDARIQVDKALASCNSSIHLSVWVPGIILQARILQAMGQADEAEEILNDALEELRRQHSPRWERLLEAAQIRCQLAKGHVSTGQAWLEQRHISTSDRPNVTREYEQITLARILLGSNDRNEAIAWLNKLLSEARRADRIGSQIEILLLLAQAYSHHEQEHAFHALEAALELAEPDNYIRIFLDEGLPMWQLLQRWIAVKRQDEGQTAAYVEQLLGAYKGEPCNRNPASTDILFTQRERELLYYIVEGRSNEEIALELFLSQGTIKRYIHHIYQKLQVRNRVQAVSKIKELNLL